MPYRSRPLRVEVEVFGDTVLVAGDGEVDEANLPLLIDVFAGITPAPGRTVLVDAGNLDFIAFEAVQVLIYAAFCYANVGCTLRVARAKPVVRRVLDVLGVDPQRLLLEETVG